MEFSDSFKKSLFSTTSQNFNERALKLFRYQAENNSIYKYYIDLLGVSPALVKNIQEIPFLPIEFFKKHKIITGSQEEKLVFNSSGTTGQERSSHFVVDPEFYKKVSTKIFEEVYGPLNEVVLLAFLPSYKENPNSSLIYMVDSFLKKTYSAQSRYYYKSEEIISVLEELTNTEKYVFLWGVSYALLDLAENHILDFSRITLIETGGMKGRRKELTREELHQIFKNRLNVINTHSEYGMSELLSQAYSKGHGVYQCPSWMKILVRELDDPFALTGFGKTGGINVIDLANIDSCAFIETKDLGKLYENGSFEVLGRMDNTDVRGCNLMYTG